jgi:phosphoglycolate phosphatase
MCKLYVGSQAGPIRLALRGREIACRAIIFDKDGTLVDPTGMQTRLTRMRALRAAAEASVGTLQGATPDPARKGSSQPPARCGGADDRSIPVDPAQGGKAADHPESYSLDIDEWPIGPGLLPGVAAALDTFQSLGLPMAVATGDRHRSAEAMLEALGVGKHFKAIVGIDDVMSGKPAPDMVHLACEQLGCSPEEVVVVGDSPADLMMGRAAGVAACIGVTGGLSVSDRLGALADAVLSTVAELPDLLVPER